MMIYKNIIIFYCAFMLISCGRSITTITTGSGQKPGVISIGNRTTVEACSQVLLTWENPTENNPTFVYIESSKDNGKSWQIINGEKIENTGKHVWEVDCEVGSEYRLRVRSAEAQRPIVLAEMLVSVPVVADITPPEVTITGSEKNGGSYELWTKLISPTLAGSCEPGLEVRLEGLGLTSPVSTVCAMGSFSTQVTLTEPDGSKSFTLSQTDKMNNKTSLNGVYYLDRAAPTITGLTDDAVPTKNKTWSFNIEDEFATVNSSCTSCSYRTVSNQNLVHTFITESFQSVIAFPIIRSQTTGTGTYYLHVQAQDKAGNLSLVYKASAVLDNTAPIIGETLPLTNTYINSSTQDLSITETCEDDSLLNISGTGVVAPQNITCIGGGWSGSITFTPGDGDKIVILTLTDSLGNVDSSTRVYNITHDPCGAGKWWTTSAGCVDVPVGFYSPANDSSRYTCPLHSVSALGSDDISDCRGNGGYYNCEAGSCSEVGRGYYSPANNNLRYMCPAGQTTVVMTADEVTDCVSVIVTIQNKTVNRIELSRIKLYRFISK